MAVKKKRAKRMSNPLPKGKFFKVTKAKINPNGSVSLVVPQSSLKKSARVDTGQTKVRY